MRKISIKYVIFKTKLGWFGLAGTENSLLKTHLPAKNLQSVKHNLLKDLRNSRPARRRGLAEGRYDKSFFTNLQRQIIAYFEGSYVDFDKNIPIAPACRGNDFSKFAGAVLKACRNIRFGQTKTYAQLAKQAGRPNAARAVGQVLAKNPLPLIIPCHRVVCSDGGLGGFSAVGGVTLKKKMLELEKSVNHLRRGSSENTLKKHKNYRKLQKTPRFYAKFYKNCRLLKGF